jgi:membrane protein EpsK
MEAPDLPPQIESATGRFRLNVLANLGYFLLNVGIGLWFTAYVIRKLGLSAYGLVPLATSITAYVSILTISLSGSVGRFVTIALTKRDDDAANRTFNTALFASLVAAIALVPILTPLAIAAPLVLDVPAGQEDGARWLLLATLAAFLITTVGSNFAVSSFARNRFDIRSAIDSLSLVVRVSAVAALFSWLTPQLWLVAAASMIAALVWLGPTVWAWRRLTPTLRVRRRDFDRRQLRALTSTGGWLAINQTAAVLFLNIDLIVVNIMVGANAGGSYAPVLQISRTLRVLAGVVAGVLTPTILSRHARQETEGMVRISQQSVKLLGVAVALPIGLLCGLARPFLQTWLGRPFGDLAPLAWLLIGPLCINLAVLPLFSVQLALNKVRWPGIVSLAMGAVNLALAVILAGPMNLGIYGVAAAGAITLTSKNAIYTPIYTAGILGRRATGFFAAMMPSVVATALVAAASTALSSAADLASWPRLVWAGMAITVPYVPLAYFLLISNEERQTIKTLVFQRTNSRT